MLVLRWFLDATRLAQVAADNRIGVSPAYRYRHEGIDVPAAAPVPLYVLVARCWVWAIVHWSRMGHPPLESC